MNQPAPRIILPDRVSRLLLAIFPFVAGLITTPVVSPVDQVLTRACILFALFGCWAALRQQMQILGQRQDSARQRSWRIIGALLLAVCILLGLQLFLLRFGDLLFYLCLFALGAAALCSAMQVRKRLVLAALAQLLYVMVICVLGFALDLPFFSWQALVFGLGVGAASTLPLLAKAILAQSSAEPTPANQNTSSGGSALARNGTPKLENRRTSKQGKQATKRSPQAPTTEALLSSLRRRTTLLRTYACCLLLAPTSIATLCYFGQLPKLYVLSFALIPYAMPVLQKVKSAEQGSFLGASLIQESSRVAALFLLILAALGIVEQTIGA